MVPVKLDRLGDEVTTGKPEDMLIAVGVCPGIEAQAA